jgi:hypothetical protein
VFKPVEDARIERLAKQELIHQEKQKQEAAEKESLAATASSEMDVDSSVSSSAAPPLKTLTKLEREEIMLSRNQFKKKMKARSKSLAVKKRGGNLTSASKAGLVKIKKRKFKS